MFNTLSTVPLELLINISSFLHFEDFVNFRNAGKIFHILLSDESVSREVVNRHIRYSREGQQAEHSLINYSTAIHRTAFRREAFASARPCSVQVIGRGKNFHYQDGVVCYVQGRSIRILDVHKASETEDVIDLFPLLLQEAESDDNYQRRWLLSLQNGFPNIQILQFQGGTLSLVVRSPRRRVAILIALDVRKTVSTPINEPKRVRHCTNIGAGRPTVRHTSRYLYYSDHFESEYLGHRERAMLYMTDLDDPEPHLISLPMHNLFGLDVGHYIDFKIHDGWLYISSNNTVADSGNADNKSSYFQCYRFPVDDPSIVRVDPTINPTPLRLEVLRLRRQLLRAEVSNDSRLSKDPSQDSCKELDLHKDECTGDLLIVEHKRSADVGTFGETVSYHLQPLRFPSIAAPDVIHDDCYYDYDADPQPPSHHLIQTVGETEIPLGEISHHFVEDQDDSVRHRTYNPGCSASLEVTFPPRSSSLSAQVQGHQFVRLRINSQVRASPIDNGTGMLYKPILNKASSYFVDRTEEHFVNRGTNVWPPANSPPELLEYLNPYSSVRAGLGAESDERSVIYIVGTWNPEREEEEGSKAEDDIIILVNFDAGIRFPGLREMNLYDSVKEFYVGNERGKHREEGSDAGLTGKDPIASIKEPFVGKDNSKGKEKAFDTSSSNPQDLSYMADDGANMPLFRTERAMWMDMGPGFQFY